MGNLNPFKRLIGTQDVFIDYKDILFQCNQPLILSRILGYYPDLNRKFKSIFRSNDKSAGCRFEWYGDFLCFVDNAKYKGKLYYNCFEIVMEQQACTFQEACQYIAKIMAIKPSGKFKYIPKTQTKKHKTIIKFTYDQWYDNNFFNKLQIPTDVLHYENVYLVYDYWTNTRKCQTIFKNSFNNPRLNLTIAYYFPKTDKTKLYVPHAAKGQIKWFSNCKTEDIWGLHDIYNSTSKTLFITKSCKDYLVLKYVFGEAAIALQNEGCTIPIDIITQLKDKFDKIILLFDNDATGIQASNKLAELYTLSQIFLPVDYGKDISESLLNMGIENNKKIIKQWNYKKL